MIRTILVDDEAIILKELTSMLEGNRYIEVVGTYTNPLDALEHLAETKPDCAFLDIEMPILGGIELSEKLSMVNMDMEVIFVTAYNNYATQAFDVNAIDYILKPIRPERLEKAVDKLVHRVEKHPNVIKSGCTIRSFGCFEILTEDHPVKWTRLKSKEFVAYMLQNEGKWVTKYKLCEEQWANYEPEQALTYLQIAVYGARKNLREAGCTQIDIEYSNDRYIIRVKGADWDVRVFDEAYDEYCRNGSSDKAKKALSVYRDEYYEGEDWLWADLCRESYICKYTKIRKEYKD